MNNRMIRARVKGFIGTSGYHYVVFGVMLSMIVWLVAYSFVAREEALHFDDTAAQAKRTAVFFERHVFGIFQYGDAYLKLVRREFLKEYDVGMIEALMDEVPLNKSIASHITIMDENGIPLLVSGHQIKPNVTAKDRDYFKFQQQAETDQAFVSRLHFGRNSGKLIIRLVRRYQKPNGDFGGVIFVALEARHVTQFFEAMNLGPRSTATLVGSDKYIRARTGWGKLQPGQNISVSRLWHKLESNPVGVFRQTAIHDDIDRYYSYRRVTDFPLIVAIGLSVDDFQQSLKVTRVNHYSIAFLASLLIAITVLFFCRQRQLLTQIEAKNIELERRADKIELTNRELQNQNDELERFSYTVSHDLKAPLVTIKGFLSLLQNDIEEGDYDSILRDAGQIGDAADRMSRLLDELLELGRVGRRMATPQNCDLNKLVQESLERVSIQRDDGIIDLQIAADMPMVSGDPGRLLEVFQNLVDNAVKFMGKQASPRIDIAATTQNGEVHCQVCDNGIGIAPEFHQRVFDLFERLDTNVEGTGVGLALVKRIIEAHGGRIWLESSGEDQGSCFHFTLPTASQK